MVRSRRDQRVQFTPTLLYGWFTHQRIAKAAARRYRLARPNGPQFTEVGDKALRRLEREWVPNAETVERIPQSHPSGYLAGNVVNVPI